MRSIVQLQPALKDGKSFLSPSPPPPFPPSPPLCCHTRQVLRLRLSIIQIYRDEKLILTTLCNTRIKTVHLNLTVFHSTAPPARPPSLLPLPALPLLIFRSIRPRVVRRGTTTNGNLAVPRSGAVSSQGGRGGDDEAVSPRSPTPRTGKEKTNADFRAMFTKT